MQKNFSPPKYLMFLWQRYCLNILACNISTFNVWFHLAGLSLYWLVYNQPRQAWDCFFFADGNHDGRPFVVSVRNCVMWISVRATHRTKTPDIIGVRLINGDITASYFCTYHKAFCCIFKTFSRAFWRAWETPACSNPVLTFIIHAVTQSQVS